MQGKTQTKIYGNELEKGLNQAGKTLKSIANYLPKSIKPAGRLQNAYKYNIHPLLKASEIPNKENLVRNESFYCRKPSIDKPKVREKSNCSFQKTPTQRSHSRIASMCDPKTLIKEEVA